MAANSSVRVVIDTNVLFEGLTKKGGATGLIIEAWVAGLLNVYISTALVYEYEEVLSRKLSNSRWLRLDLMSPLTLQLPETLRDQLTRLAVREGVSLDQYILYALTRQVSATYSVQVASQSEVAQQEADLQQWIQSSAPCSKAEAAEILAEREPVEGDHKLGTDIVDRFQKMIHPQH